MTPWFFGFPLFFLFPLLFWAIFVIIGLFIYQDAEKHGMNGLLWLILVIIAPISIIIYLIIREEKEGTLFPRRSPREILDTRYARGEITEEEYKRKKKELLNETEEATYPRKKS
ncbi:MAG: SHOCT domain-containing protein [Candidatus Korarchaeota archaeon]|nr:SHOCT domain-containing protein [Candidatus Korarchaeota archaeon]NIU85110.1 SHOCT domain-containing protein [Candidatus Thorarchaeota archaeon]NIW15074.1 SHOCT domain-containing protein [Candidatus Thorarchaeota archaeon]NIW53084.1 SHOCT domain-containing protein [Candidatus Korarchaeota archaeon]